MSSTGEGALAERAKAKSQQDRDAVDALVVEMVHLHAESLLRLARRHSICADDAHDAYQRGFEIFLRHAQRLDPERAPAWLRTVVKHEAMAVRKARQRDMGPAEFQADTLEARHTPSPDEQVVSAEHVERSAEALGRCKPQEVRALWLQAQGNSYAEIEQITGWTRTKVNRCLYEGRQSFLSRYAGIESGEECERWGAVLSALVDGEATTAELLELRPHLRHCSACRGVVRELHRSRSALAVVFPAAVVAASAAGEHAEPAGQVFVRVFETTSNWLGERAASSVIRAQLVVDGVMGSAAKATAVAATAATVAGGGAVAIEQVSRAASAQQAGAAAQTRKAEQPAAPTSGTAAEVVVAPPATTSAPPVPAVGKKPSDPSSASRARKAPVVPAAASHTSGAAPSSGSSPVAAPESAPAVSVAELGLE